MAAKEIRQKVSIDTGDSAREIREVEEAAKQTERAVEGVDDAEIRIDTDAALRELADLDRQSKEISQRKIEIRAELDASGFDTKEIDRRVADTGGSLDGLSGKIRDIGSVVDEQTAGMAGDFTEAFAGISEAAEAAGPRVQAALAWVSNLGIVAVATGGAIWALSKINSWLNDVIATATDSKGAMDRFAASTDLATAALEAQRLEQQALTDAPLLQRLSQAWSGYYSGREAREEAFQELMEKSPALAQKFLDTIRTSPQYAIVDEGETVKLDSLRDKVVVTSSEIDRMEDALTAAKDAEVQARLANEDWSAQVEAAYARATGKVLEYNAAVAGAPVPPSSSFLDRIPLPSIGTLNVYQPAGTDGREVDRSMTYYERYHGTGGWSSNP
jgi:hypothetical protein